MNDPMATWRGEVGWEYALRHPSGDRLSARRVWLEEVLGEERFWAHSDGRVRVLEVGCGTGANLGALWQWLSRRWVRQRRLLGGLRLIGTDVGHGPLLAFRQRWPFPAVEADAGILPFRDRTMDVILTSGLLIHVQPGKSLEQVCGELVRVCRGWLLVAEYFSPKFEEIPWRGHAGLLWKGDYGKFLLDGWPRLQPVDCGFLWKRTTGLDNLTWWLFRV